MAEKLVDKIIETDVLIVGTEGAGAIAGIKASDFDVRVTLITKGSWIGKAGATITCCHRNDVSIDSRSASELLGLPGDKRDSPETFFEDVVIGGRYVNNQMLVESLTKNIPRVAKELADWGYVWYKEDVGLAPGHRYPRGCYGDPKNGLTGPQMLYVMEDVLTERKNVEILGNMFVLDLLTTDGKLSGVAALDMATGEFTVIKAKSAILATGGIQACYPRHTTGREMTGDGQAMAYRVGAELTDMQFVQFTAAQIYPAHPSASVVFLLLEGFLRYYNKYGERYMEKLPKKERSTRDVRALAHATEIFEGRGSEHGGVYCSIKHVPRSIIDYWARVWGPAPERYEETKEGHDMMLKDEMTFEIGHVSHFMIGGIRIDENGASTNVPGLYAAGECAGGVHGANRLSGNALAQVLVQGAVAGEAAGKYAEKCSRLEPEQRQIGAIRRRVFAPLVRESGVGPISLRKEIRGLAGEKIMVIREESTLIAALKEIGEIREKKIANLYTTAKQRRYNLEWIEALQVENVLQVLEAISHSALYRKESRGAHYRKDYPRTDNNNWLKNVVLKKVGDKVEIKAVPVIMTKIKPPMGVFDYPQVS